MCSSTNATRAESLSTGMDAVATFPFVAFWCPEDFPEHQAYGNDYKIAARVSPEILQSEKHQIVLSVFPISFQIPLTALP